MYSTFPRFSVEKQNAQAEQSALGAELVSATKSPPRRGLGVGRVVNAVATPQEKVPDSDQGLNSIGLHQPLFKRNYILYAILLVMRLQLLVAVGEDKQLVAHLQLRSALRHEVVTIAADHNYQSLLW